MTMVTLRSTTRTDANGNEDIKAETKACTEEYDKHKKETPAQNSKTAVIIFIGLLIDLLGKFEYSIKEVEYTYTVQQGWCMYY